MQKKILFAGGSHSDIPMIEAARKLNYFVITSGNNPLDKGHVLADQVVLADFSDKNAILEVAKALKINAICSSSNDFSVVSCSYVAQELVLPGFDSYETTLMLHHKNQFRELASSIGMPIPKTKIFSGYKSLCNGDVLDLKYPLMVKPIDLTGGKGIRKISEPSEFPLNLLEITQLSHKNEVVVEEFIKGTLHSFSTFLVNKKIVFDYADNEYSFLNPYLVATSSSPGRFSNEIRCELKKEIEKLAQELKLVDGLLHAQFILEDSSFKFIEFTRRCPGDFYSVPVMLSTKFNHAEAIVLNSLGKSFQHLKIQDQNGFFSRHCAMPTKSGTYMGVQISNEIKNNILKYFPLLPLETDIQSFLSTKVGIYFLQYSSEIEMHEKTRNINELIRVIIE